MVGYLRSEHLLLSYEGVGETRRSVIGGERVAGESRGSSCAHLSSPSLFRSLPHSALSTGSPMPGVFCKARLLCPPLSPPQLGSHFGSLSAQLEVLQTPNYSTLNFLVSFFQSPKKRE